MMGLDNNFATDLLLNGLLVVGSLVGIVLTIVCSRRGFLIGSFIFLAACLALMSVVPTTQSALLIAIFAAFTLILSAVSNLVGVFPAESFPTEVRSNGVGFATSMSRFGSAISTAILPLSVVHLGLPATTGILAFILVIGAIVSIAWAPETKGLTLTDAAQSSPPPVVNTLAAAVK
jgi:putative MFS transporter